MLTTRPARRFSALSLLTPGHCIGPPVEHREEIRLGGYAELPAPASTTLTFRVWTGFEQVGDVKLR